MPYYLYLSLKQLFPTGKPVSVFASISILGVALGVTVLVVVQSIMNGFGMQIRSKLQLTTGDIKITASYAIDNPHELISRIESVPGVEVAQSFSEGIVMLQHDSRPSFPMVYGLDVSRETHAIPVKEFLIQGSLEDLDDGRILLGSGQALKVGARIGSKVDVYTPLLLEKLKRDEVLLPREMEVCGIIQSGYKVVDDSLVIVTLRTMQELYGFDNEVHGIAVKVSAGASVEDVALKLNREVLPPDFRARTWMDTHESYLFVLAFEKAAMFVINLVIVIVAAFCLAVALYTAVLRKTREIGLLGAMGADSRGITLIFGLQGLIVGTTGTLLGFGLSGALLGLRGPIIRTIFRWTETEATYVRFYHFLEFPVQFQFSDFVFISLFSISITTLAAFIPALIASRMKPATALRYE